MSLPGYSRLVLVADQHNRRYSEADIIELTDGRLLLNCTRKSTGGDFSRGQLIGLFSEDSGLTWSDKPQVIIEPWGDRTDVMSVSLCRSPRGIHLIFLARGKDPHHDTGVYQSISTDEGQTFPTPARISPRDGYHIVNNARVIRTSKGRMIVPAAYVSDSVANNYEGQHIYTFHSDDDGQTWHDSNDITLVDHALMEPGVAECADGSLYMTIRTKLGCLYEARSYDHGQTWQDFGPSSLPAPAAPSTVFRDPTSDDLWMFWCPRADADWKMRNPQMLAISHDNGKTWSDPRPIETATDHSFGYISVDVVRNHVLLTYYDWHDQGQKGFEQTCLRFRAIPLDWFHQKPISPTFTTQKEPVLKPDHPWESSIVSMNSGLLIDKNKWRLYYTAGSFHEKTEHLQVCYAESKDEGKSWTKPQWPDAPVPNSNIILPPKGEESVNCYHTSIHRNGDDLEAYVWRYTQDAGEGKNTQKVPSGLYRYESSDYRTFNQTPKEPLFIWHPGSYISAHPEDANASNDAFDMLVNEDGSHDYYAACLVPPDDQRALIPHDNAKNVIRVLGHAHSSDGITFTPIEIILKPDYSIDRIDTQFYGMQVFRYRRFYLGLVHVFHAQSQVIVPEWTWSHDGINFARTRTPAISLGDERNFDCRMIVFGRVVITENEMIYLYSGSNWRHNAYKEGHSISAIGRAVMPRKDLDDWLDTLPEP